MNYIILIVAVIMVIFIQFFFYKRQLDKLQERAGQDKSLDFMQQQVDNLRDQIAKSLDSNAQLFSQQLSLLTNNISNNFNQLNSQVNQQLNNNTQLIQKTQQSMGERLDHASRTVNQVGSKLAQLEEANKRLFEVGKDISSLQELLKAPKLRGGLGEFLLGDLLSQMFPSNCYDLQYSFKNGERVDAIVRLAQGMVPIDAKFPLENFKAYIEANKQNGQTAGYYKQFINDVKKHVNDIATKYIKPDETNFDFALMYIPAENIYYETIIKDERFGEDKSIANYALSKKVIPVSPNSLYAYLLSILLGLKSLRIEKSAQEIINHLSGLRKDLVTFQGDFQRLGGHIERSKSSYETAEKRLEKFDQKLVKIESISPSEPKKIEN